MPSQHSLDEQRTAPEQGCAVHAAAVHAADQALAEPHTSETQPEPATIETVPKLVSHEAVVNSAADRVRVGSPLELAVDAALPMHDTSAAPSEAVVALPTPQDSQTRAQRWQQRCDTLQLSPDIGSVSLAAVLPLLPSDSCTDSPTASDEAPPQGGPTAAAAQQGIGWQQRQRAQVSCSPGSRRLATMVTAHAHEPFFDMLLENVIA